MTANDPEAKKDLSSATAKQPAQEPCDVNADPIQIYNLVGDTLHKEVLDELDSTLTGELQKSNDPCETG